MATNKTIQLIKNSFHCMRFSLTGMLLFLVSHLFANIKLPAIFSDKMVLQQQSKVAVWGWADPGEKITITGSWSAKAVSITTDASGNWKGMLQTPKAGGPYTVKIKGMNSIDLTDVLIGEVWVCSGQSNMVYALKGSEGAASEIPLADFPSIRYFSVKRQYGPEPFDDAPGSVWQKTSPSTAASFSAVAYYFAKKIYKDLKVPVGIVYATWGGTPAEAWTPPKVLQEDDSLQRYIKRWGEILQKVGADSTAFHLAMESWKKDSNTQKKPTEPQTFYYYKRPWREPGVLFNGMINPVIPYSVKGVLWYQGESNVSFADEYEYLFSTLIKSWREKWNSTNSPTFPFYFVQLPPFGYSDLDAAARLRKAQQHVANKIPQTGLVATIDLGNMKDIHPTRKKEVGERLALLALNKTYGYKGLMFSGPAFKKARLNDKVGQAFIEKGKVQITFDQKLFTTNHQKAGGFEIGYKHTGSDSLRFIKAECRIDGNEVIVWNSAIENPLIVRYAWIEIGEANLVNEAGLPTMPFSEEIKQ